MHEALLCVRAQLTDEERVFLNAAALGDVGVIRQQLEELETQEQEEPEKPAAADAATSSSIAQQSTATSSADKPRKFNVNCVDYMGRCAVM